MYKTKYFSALTAMLGIISTLVLTSCDTNPNSTTDTYYIVSDGTSVSANEEEAQHAPAKFMYDDMTTLYGYNQLSDRQKEIYDDVVQRLSHFEPTIPLEASSEEMEKILELIRIEQLSFSHVVGRSIGDFNTETQKYDINIEYRFTDVQLEQMNYEVVKKADSIMLGITDDMTDYDKLKYFHDYLITNTESNVNDEYSDTMYGTLIRKKALCEGYAKTFSYLCNRAGIKNLIVTGYTGVAHMWNMVKLGDKWYHVDVTWDNPDKRISEYFPDLIQYQYLLTTDDVIENHRNIDRDLFIPPVADDLSMSYFEQEDLNPANYDELLDLFNKRLPIVKDTKQKYMLLKFNSTDMYAKIVKLLTTPDDKNMCVIDYYSQRNGMRITLTDYYSMDRVLLLIFYYE